MAQVTKDSAGSITLAAAPLPLGLRRFGSRTPMVGTPAGARRDRSRFTEIVDPQDEELDFSHSLGILFEKLVGMAGFEPTTP